MVKRSLAQKVRERVQILCNDEPRTQQQFKDQCDINKIVARFTRDNGIDASQLVGFPAGGMFGDFTDVPDLRTMHERLAKAEAAFYTFPSKIRSKFDNDPLRFIEWFDDPKNDGEKRELGLLPPLKKDDSIATPESAITTPKGS